MFRLLLLALLVLGAVLAVRTVLYRADAPADRAAPSIAVDDTLILEHLSQAVRYPTVSRQPPQPIDAGAFVGFLNWLESTYPRVFATLDAERVNEYSLLLTWPGTDPALPGVLFAGHYDVVPVIEGTEASWSYPPFAGTIADGYVWGRGSVDNKNGVIGLMEAVDWMLAHDERPARTLYFSFGHDEEIGGAQGAAAVVEQLQEAGTRVAWSLDEGSFVFDGMLPGVEVPVALINTAEKGSVTVRLIATGEGGHSSMPPRVTAVGRLARALVALERQPMPGGLEGLALESFDAVAPHMDWLPRMMFANRWLFEPLIERQLATLTFADAMMRTTTAPTMLSGSPKENVLPVEAVATINFRIHPRDSVDDVVRHVETVAGGGSVRVEALPGHGASEVADAGSDGFRLLRDAVQAEFAGVVVAPGLLVAATDSRHYAQVADNAFRFNPMVITPDELTGFHGIDERISGDGMVRGVRTYVRLFRTL